MNEQKWGRVRIHWIDTKDGSTGVYTEEAEGPNGSVWEDDEFPDGWDLFMWIDGNYSCDCNRALFFKNEDWESLECGDGRLNILSIEVQSKSGGPWKQLKYSEGDNGR